MKAADAPQGDQALTRLPRAPPGGQAQAVPAEGGPAAASGRGMTGGR